MSNAVARWGLLWVGVLAAAVAASQPQPPPSRPRPALQAPVPVVPSFNFEYLGSIGETDGARTVYLGRADQMYMVKAGTILDDVFRVEAIEPDRIALTHVPTGTRIEKFFTELRAAGPVKPPLPGVVPPGTVLSVQPPAGQSLASIPRPGPAPTPPQRAGTPQPNATPQTGPALLFGAPARAVMGKDLTVTLGLPPGANVRSLEADIYYQPAQFELTPARSTPDAAVAITPREPGRVTVRVENQNGIGAPPPTSLRLRAIGIAPATAQLMVTNVTIEDHSGNSVIGAMPPPRTVVLVPK
jgi:hypothetical protein